MNMDKAQLKQLITRGEEFAEGYFVGPKHRGIAWWCATASDTLSEQQQHITNLKTEITRLREGAEYAREYIEETDDINLMPVVVINLIDDLLAIDVSKTSLSYVMTDKELDAETQLRKQKGK